MAYSTARGQKRHLAWPAWRSSYFPGMNLYHYKVTGGEPVLGVYGGEGVHSLRLVNVSPRGELLSCRSM